MNRTLLKVSIILMTSPIAFVQASSSEEPFSPNIPKTWDEAALADWATPVAWLNVRPTHISAKEYYLTTVENLRTYPVYFPGREPEGYWEMLRRVGPKPLIEPEKLKSEADWIEAGRIVFEEVDDLHLRTFVPELIAKARDPKTFEGRQPLPDGRVSDLRWVPTKNGIALSLPNCASCHVQRQPDGARIPGAPNFDPPSVSKAGLRGRSGLVRPLQTAMHSVTGAPPFLMGDESFGAWLYQAYGVPWKQEDIHERMKTMPEAEYNLWINSAVRGGGVPRWNGSPYYPAKMPDLIGLKDRKYIDHTATHLQRGIGDLMRYAALVSFAEASDFGPYHMLAPTTKRAQARLSDEALYALALYIYSLKPPPNPNPFDEKAKAGQKIFAREGCIDCHTPPLYTNNKLTLAEGFTPPKDAPATLDILPISVSTDPGLALATRKGTGYYKTPSLKGVWYRGHYLHDGSAASLEELFDPDRLRETHKPGGWSPPGAETRAIKGHEFGLRLSAEERSELIAFLRTL
jgi:mono/diheme cytochrome c family protein